MSLMTKKCYFYLIKYSKKIILFYFYSSTHIPAHCLEENTLISGAVVFLVIQVIILTMFVFLWKRKRDYQSKEVITPPESTTDSLSYMYESGFTRRLQ